MRKIIALGIMLLFLGMTISSISGFNLEEQSTILKFNNPPYIPSDPEPKNGSTGVDTGILSWTGGDPDPDDMVTYEFYFGNETNPPYIMLIGPYPANLTNFTYQIGQPLEYYTTYYWRIVAEDNNGATTNGPLWSFTTMKCPGNTLYVGGNGTGNYTKIQDAIDDASSGDTVYVYDDSSPYYENVIVDKSITLKGENKETTVINGSDSEIVVNISSDNVILSGFTILNHGNSSYLTSIIFIQSNYNVISANIIKVDNDYGIDIIYSEYTTISGNTITSNTSKGWYAIFIYEGKNNNISGNIIKNFKGGIVFVYSNNYSIYGNTLIDNKNAINSAGFSINGVISLNNISGGIFGIYALNCFNYKIIKNNFMGNYRNAGFGYYLAELFVFGFKYKSIRDIRSTIKWDGNYWNRPRIFPKPILGELPPAGRIPWIMFDWHPAQEPYDIGV